MSTTTSNNKRLISNTFFLTLRMLFLMVITFFTSRVVLDKLGFVDYGIQNVVGGLTSMFVFFRSSLSNVTQRYLNVELANDNIEGATKVFRRHQTLYICITVVVVILLETAGLWFLYNKLVIPEDRMIAAFWVFQFMVISLSVTMLSVVYDAAIIAHEDFNVYAYVGLIEGISKLAVAYIISVIHFDRLITYSFLLLFIAFSLRVFYTVFCHRRYAECDFHLDFNKKAFGEAFSMIGWNTLGTAVYAINNQGIDILLNLFFGPVINAAKGIATAINQAILTFSNNFNTSMRPQLVKSYASGDEVAMLNLFYRASKYAFFILWLVCLPVIVCIDDILALWLKDVPEHANTFVQLVLCYSLINVLDNPIWSLALAVGKLKWYILIGSFVFLMSFPISYACLKMGTPPEMVFIVNAVVRAVYILVVLNIICHYVPISRRRYFIDVIVPIAIVVLFSGGIAWTLNQYFPEIALRWIMVGLLCVVTTFAVVWTLGMKQNERKFFYEMLLKKIPLLKGKCK